MMILHRFSFLLFFKQLIKQTNKQANKFMCHAGNLFTAMSHPLESFPATATLIPTPSFSFYSWSDVYFFTKTNQQIALRFPKVTVCSRHGSKKFQDVFWLKVLDICGDTEKQGQPRNVGQPCPAPTLPQPSQNTQARVGSWLCCSQSPPSQAQLTPKGYNLNFHLPETSLFHADDTRVSQTP